MGTLRFLGLILISFGLVNCAKGKSGPSASAASTSNNVTAGQSILCPITGYYEYNGINYQCTPGQMVIVGNIGGGGAIPVNPAPTPFPTPAPNPGGVPVTNVKPPKNACDHYSAQYPGVKYVVAHYQGGFVCMRDDIAARYGLAAY